MNCSESTLSGGALPEQLAHQDRLFDIRVGQLRRAEAAVRVLQQQMIDFVDNLDRRGIPLSRDNPRIANILLRFASANNRVTAAHRAIEAVMDRRNELMAQLPAYYASLTYENIGPPNQQLNPDRESILVPVDNNANTGNPGVPEVRQLDGLGAPYPLFG